MADVNDIDAPLSEVAREFPGQRARIEALAAASEEFRMLCEDYILSAVTLRRLLESGYAVDSAWVRDYREALAGLLREISAALAAASTH
ncbi:MAG: hypothetical protein L6R19_08665 [Alphaproteobacteria bacterium]|nr:hypothetical protein [Alphaproteobacteria bacterium]